ncbi:hypothetical protein KSX_74260 [Ktedonospora formicarum]|uniref:Uncharacterized protein n=1 Tax=Ktedonospora formicarum TaxID=2778364 RepID=A0A8J3IBI2_9CHLR|nr:hypothetical protein KSX_74260 [Ktedonospora formicarum]
MYLRGSSSDLRPGAASVGDSETEETNDEGVTEQVGFTTQKGEGGSIFMSVSRM